jgi:hypothetical protein
MAAERARQLAAIADTATAVKKSAKAAKAQTQTLIAEAKEKKVAEANFARYLTEQRRKRMQISADERLADVHARSGEDRERAKTAIAGARANRKGKPADQFRPLFDEHEEAAIGVRDAVGAEIGDLESHMIADVLSGLLE